MSAQLAAIALAWQPLLDQLAKDTIAINKKVNSAPTFAALRGDWRTYYNLQKRYDDAVYALPWPEQLRPQIDAWKAVHDDRLALFAKLTHVRNNKELGRLYHQDEAFGPRLTAVANPLLSAVGLPTR